MLLLQQPTGARHAVAESSDYRAQKKNGTKNNALKLSYTETLTCVIGHREEETSSMDDVQTDAILPCPRVAGRDVITLSFSSSPRAFPAVVESARFSSLVQKRLSIFKSVQNYSKASSIPIGSRL